MRGKTQIEFLQNKGDVGARLGVPDQEQFAAVGCRDAHIEHLDGGKFLEDDPRHQPGGVAAQLLAQGGHEAISEEGDEQVRFDALGFLVKDRAQAQISLEGTKRLLDVAQLHVAVPDQRGILGSHVRAQQIPALSLAHRAQPARSSS